MSGIINAFTVDVEDYFQVSAFADRISTFAWEQFESRVVANTHRVLRLLAKHETRGTFFVLGWVADRFPSLLRDIVRDGHEIGCHSYWHQLVYNQTEEQFREDLIRARDAIAAATGVPVVAYRAPSFSITARSLWALDILVDEGFTFDSSIFPVHHDRYGMPGARRFAHVLNHDGGSLTEFPPTTWRIGGTNFPVAGGGYFRLLPAAITRRAIRLTNDRHREPFMFYIHPWELDPDQPRLSARFKARLRHYQNLASTERKLSSLLSSARFGSMQEALACREVVSTSDGDKSEFSPQLACPSTT